MTHQTPEQAAKRINKAIDKKYPLIGAHFHTTPAEQAVRYERLDASQQSAKEMTEELHRDFYGRAAGEIYMLIEHLGEEHANTIAAEREGLEKQWPSLQQPAYIADFWFTTLRRFVQGGC